MTNKQTTAILEEAYVRIKQDGELGMCDALVFGFKFPLGWDAVKFLAGVGIHCPKMKVPRLYWYPLTRTGQQTRLRLLRKAINKLKV